MQSATSNHRFISSAALAGLLAGVLFAAPHSSLSAGSSRTFRTTPLATSISRWVSAPSARVIREARRMVADPFSIFGARSRMPVLDPKLETTPSLLPKSLASGVAIVIDAEAAAQRIAGTAFARLTPAESTKLRSQDSLRRQIEELERSVRTGRIVAPRGLEFAAKIDSEALMRAAQTMARGAELATPFFQRYARELDAGTLGPVKACNRPGPIFCDRGNIIEVWGTGDDTYTVDSPAIIRVDLGGDDTYYDQTGAATGASCRLATLPCSDALGFKLNVDVSGDDTYLDPRTGPGPDYSNGRQGYGLFGVGVLVDAAGNDAYSAADGQGLGVEGAGLLVDTSGSDSYHSTGFAQGVGILAGTGLLVDGGGDDLYETTVGQGLGLVAMGALVDAGGRDSYGAVGYSQGIGLGVGAGLLIDARGNDRYGATDEPGAFLQGTADQSGAGALIDLAGNDNYSATDLSQGCATEGGDALYLLVGPSPFRRQTTDTFAVFLDASGVDRYSGPGLQTMGYATALSMARFRDLGASADRYESANPKPRNNAAWRQGDGYVRVLNHDTRIPNGEGEDH